MNLKKLNLIKELKKRAIYVEKEDDEGKIRKILKGFKGQVKVTKFEGSYINKEKKAIKEKRKLEKIKRNKK